MEIRDVIHGAVSVSHLELPIIDSRFFQRLREIKQLGFAENSFPGVTHNRYVHSLGAMQAATRVFESIFKNKINPQNLEIPEGAFNRFRAVTRLGALLHDIGHGPLSHTTEFAMPEVKTLGVPGLSAGKDKSRKATHEDYTLKMILDSGLTSLIKEAGAPFGFSPLHVASLVEPQIQIPHQDEFFMESKVNFRPILQQIISSELDADRMDYLRRDSLYAGVSYGQFDFEWLVRNLTFHIYQSSCFLCLEHRALYAFEDFLLSRFHMFLMVYFHHKSVIFDEMLGQYFSSPDCDYFIPSEIEAYCAYTDAQLYNHLSQSGNAWAKRIIEKKPYRMLIELHSGIPAAKATQIEQQNLLTEIKAKLTETKVNFLCITSTSEISKYFGKPGDSIFVRYDNHYNRPSFIPLGQCSDLFKRYQEKRTITRLYVSPEDYEACVRMGQAT